MVRQNALLIILVLVLTATVFIWYQYLRLTVPEEPQTNELEMQLQDLRNLNNIQIDTEILQNPTFRTLEAPIQATTTGIKPGRENPFLSF